MVKQFPLGLCGLLQKSKLSLVSVSFMVLQVTSGSLGEVRCILCISCGTAVCYDYEVLSYAILV